MFRRKNIFVIASAHERFSPKSETWTVPFTVFNTSVKDNIPVISLAGVFINNNPVNIDAIRILNGDTGQIGVIDAGRYLPANEIKKWYYMHKLRQNRIIPRIIKLPLLSFFNKNFSYKARSIPELTKPENEINIPVRAIRTLINHKNTLEVVIRDSTGNLRLGFKTKIEITELPGYCAKNRWIAGSIHVHSTYSDGKLKPSEIKPVMKERGYCFTYLTDGHHTKQLLDDCWPEYRREMYKLSDNQMALFPGVETAAGSPGKDEGHLLAYGTNQSIDGLEEHVLTPQELINAALSNEPSAPSSASVAHPLGYYRWRDFDVTGYNGIEVMSGALQLFFSLHSGPSRLWRREMMRLLNHGVEGKGFPAPHAGSDWHGYWFEVLRHFVTWLPADKNWDKMSYHERKAEVDRKLSEGKTIVSRYGSLAFFKINNKFNAGSVIRNVKPKTVLNLYVEYRSVREGTSGIFIYRNNIEEKVFQRKIYFNTGETKSWEATITFPGGRQAYWLYAKGPDFIYTSPVFVSED